MDSKPVHKLSALWIATILILVLAASLACAIGPFSRQGNNLNVTVKLSEETLNLLIDNATSRVDEDEILLDDVTAVDLLGGIARVHGTYRRPDGSTAEGSYDFQLSAENGDLKAQITDVNIEGLSLDDPRVEALNRRIESELAQAARQSEGEVEFTNVEIFNDEVTITVSVKVGN